MAKFRKKPVVVEAFRFTVPMEGYLPGWLADALRRKDVMFRTSREDDPAHLLVSTLVGARRADQGDWIIQGVNGELYPCKPDIFEATYEPASDE